MNIQKADYFYSKKFGNHRVVGFSGESVVLVPHVFDIDAVKICSINALMGPEWEYKPYNEIQKDRILPACVFMGIGILLSAFNAIYDPASAISGAIIILVIPTMFSYPRIMGFLVDRKLRINGVIHDRDRSRLDKKCIVVS